MTLQDGGRDSPASKEPAGIERMMDEAAERMKKQVAQRLKDNENVKRVYGLQPNKKGRKK